jgi:hypothetical protein
MSLPNDVTGTYATANAHGHSTYRGREDTPRAARLTYAHPYSISENRVQILSPSAGSTITTYTILIIKVHCPIGSQVKLSAAFDGIAGAEVVYDGTAFIGPYLGECSLFIDAPGELRFELGRDGGWPASPALTAYVLES